MADDGGAPEMQLLAELIEELGLGGLGYRVSYQIGPAGHVNVHLKHPLLGDGAWTASGDPKEPEWAESIRDLILSWPDVELVRAANIRPQAVEIIVALRHGANMARSHKSEEKTDGALHAISFAAMKLANAGVLTRDEADWLLRALDADQDWL